MTVDAETYLNDHVGTDSTDTYSYSFRIQQASDLLVTKRATNTTTPAVLILGVDYTVTGVGDANGGTIVLTAGNLPTGETLRLRQDPPLTQTARYRGQSDFLGHNHEDSYDRAVKQMHALQEQIDRSIRGPEQDAATMVLPAADIRALRVPAFDADGNVIVVSEVDGFNAVNNIIIDEFRDGTDFTAGVTTELTLSEDPGNKENLEVIFDEEQQHWDTFSVSGTTLTFTSPIPGGTTKADVRFTRPLGIGVPGDNTVTTNTIVDNSVTINKIEENVVSFTDVVVPYAANVTLDRDTSAHLTITLTGNITIDAINNIDEGQEMIVEFIQDGAGGHTIDFGTTVLWTSGTAPAFSTGAAATDTVVIRKKRGRLLAVLGPAWGTA